MTYSPHDTHSPILSATRARQGRWGQHVFWVLVFGTLLAALGLFAAWTWRADELASTQPTQFEAQAQAKGFDTPQPPPPNPNSPDPAKW
jgi:hypothetical protein